MKVTIQMRETYPALAQQAKVQGADIYFWDESGFRADTVHGKTWGVRGQTPVVLRPGQRQSFSAASAVNAKGAFWFCIYEGALKRGAVYRAAAVNDEVPPRAAAPGTRQPAGTQEADHAGREDVRKMTTLHSGQIG